MRTRHSGKHALKCYDNTVALGVLLLVHRDLAVDHGLDAVSELHRGWAVSAMCLLHSL